MTAMVRQTAFNRGELDPALSGRDDWQSYFSGARTLRNMLCRIQGGVVKRAGTEFVTTALEQDRPTRLLRFRAAAGQVYVIEMGNRRARILHHGGVIVYPDGHPSAGREVIIASPYTLEQAKSVVVAQKEDIMVFTHPDVHPRILKRLDHHLWSFEKLVTGVAIQPPAGLAFEKDGRNGAQYKVAAIGADDEESLPCEALICQPTEGQVLREPYYDIINIQECRQVWVTDYKKTWPAKYDLWDGLPSASDVVNLLIDSLGYVNDGVALTRPDGTTFAHGGKGRDALVNEALAGINQGFGGVLAEMRDMIRDYVTENNEKATASGHSIIFWEPSENAVKYRVYRQLTKDGAGFYWLGDTLETTFEDNNTYADRGLTPQVENVVWDEDDPGTFPGVCAFYQQRLLVARSNRKPSTVWGSRTGTYRNFNKNEGVGDGATGISDTSGFEHTLDASEFCEIYWIAPMASLLIGTSAGEWRMHGRSGLLSAVDVIAIRQSNYGCSTIPPVVIGQAVVGVGSNGRTLRAYQWDYAGDAYQGTTVSHYAGHLFPRRRRIVDNAYLGETESVLWAVMSDGALLGCTYMNEEEVLGWSRHDTDGRFESVVASTSEDGEDEALFIVAREAAGGGVRRYIERMKTVQADGDDIADAWYVDSGLHWNGAPSREFSGLEHLEGKDVVCLGDGHVIDGLTVEDGGVTLPFAVSRAVVGLPYAAEMETMEMEPVNGEPIAATGKNRVVASVLFYHSRECYHGHAGRERPMELEFRGYDEPHAQSIAPKTIRKNFLLMEPVEDNRAILRLTCPSPVPFGVLSAMLYCAVDDVSPNHGIANRRQT